ncbi:cyclic pyranopterin phosphate synthase [Terribacillus halophilus]|uniref:Cyclic pyranopterin monophosphate synthase n=1 Tax=Terribacillus halophilus TaxID=361279 RepID=A0A1G6TGI0_9BACI|nr:cyclic pyranopterin monophosphate synthase MoaC [Terribacillus halophilus]SDD28173.1 cyclic pyranopterin phosphate synthase [Terribacillus halophilus]
MENSFTHFNEQARAHMVDVTNKQPTARKAIARTSVRMNEDVYRSITELRNKKGDVLAVAQVAGVMGAKQTSNLIPMCHPIPVGAVDIQFQWKQDNDIHILCIQSEVKTTGLTGVEMEALTAASTVALTIYDMCKAVDKRITIGELYLQEKSGGKSGDFKR